MGADQSTTNKKSNKNSSPFCEHLSLDEILVINSQIKIWRISENDSVIMSHVLKVM